MGDSKHRVVLAVALLVIVGLLTFQDVALHMPAVLGTSVLASSAAFSKSSLVPPACDFGLPAPDPACPRYVTMDFPGAEGAGLGDRFMQFLVGVIYAMDLGAQLLDHRFNMDRNCTHHAGSYAWVTDFLRLDYSNANLTAERVLEMHPEMSIIPDVKQYGDGYNARIQNLKGKCHTIIHVSNEDCENNGFCYFADGPRVYERTRDIVGCWFRHVDRASLPKLIFDRSEYNVVIHLRTGDMTILAEHQGGQNFFSTLKAQLDEILSPHYAVHYYLFAEAPENATRQEWHGHTFGEPPAKFEFLNDVFGKQLQDKAQEDGTGRLLHPFRVSFINDFDVKTTVYHQMNADMHVATGSSFAYVASAVSPKPIVLFGQTKEHNYAPVFIRNDYALLDPGGKIFQPTLNELSGLVHRRYAEVHDKVVPY